MIGAQLGSWSLICRPGTDVEKLDIVRSIAQPLAREGRHVAKTAGRLECGQVLSVQRHVRRLSPTSGDGGRGSLREGLQSGRHRD